MAVLQMQRISLCALKKNRKAILERLQELGAMEIDIRLEDDSGYTTMERRRRIGRWRFFKDMLRSRRECWRLWRESR